VLLFFSVFAAADGAKAQQKREVRPIGCFANLGGGMGHAGGYSVRLWAWGRTILGIIDYLRGLPGDPAVGFLTDVDYDPLTGKVDFEAKLTSGSHSCDKHKGIPSHDLLSFTGVLKSDRLEGDLMFQNQLDSPPVVLDQRKSFVMPRRDDCHLDSYEIYEIWWWYWEPVYSSRGPKW
jgi:hypothetical protein